MPLATLKKRSEFQRVQRGKKYVAPAFILYAMPREDAGSLSDKPRFGFTVSGKAVAKHSAAGKQRGHAVDRNRARRRLKEAIRLAAPAHAQMGTDYVVIGRAEALTRDFAALLADVQAAFHKCGRTAKRVKPLEQDGTSGPR